MQEVDGHVAVSTRLITDDSVVGQTDGTTLEMQVVAIRKAIGQFLTKSVNGRFRAALEGEFEVYMVEGPVVDIRSLTETYLDFGVRFRPHVNYCGIDYLDTEGSVIDVQAAELNEKYVQLAESKRWKLSHTAIVEVMEHIDQQGIGRLDEVVADVCSSLDNDDAWPTVLQKFAVYVNNL